jgi:hypothetical protein
MGFKFKANGAAGCCGVMVTLGGWRRDCACSGEMVPNNPWVPGASSSVIDPGLAHGHRPEPEPRPQGEMMTRVARLGVVLRNEWRRHARSYARHRLDDEQDRAVLEKCRLLIIELYEAFHSARSVGPAQLRDLFLGRATGFTSWRATATSLLWRGEIEV